MDVLWWGALVFARILPSVLLLDGFGGRRMPWPASAGLAVCGVILVFPYSGFSGSVPHGGMYLGVLLKEIFVGSVLAVGAGGIFYCLRMAGQVMDGTRGAGRSQSPVLMDGTRASPLAMLYTLIACAVFLELGGAQGLIRGLVGSFQQLPIESFPSDGMLHLALTWTTGVFKIAMEMALWLAWPAMAAVIVVDLILGAASRSAPGLPVYFIGLPIKSSIGVLMAGFVLTRIAPVVSEMLGFVTGS